MFRPSSLSKVLMFTLLEKGSFSTSTSLHKEYNKEKIEGQSFLDWLGTKDRDYLLKIPLGLKKGGVVVSISDYLKQREKPKIKRLNLDAVAPGKAIDELTEAEREVVKNLLRMTFDNLK